MATNRFICDICNKGFQIEHNLQLHRRGHNLPWKLKQKSNKKVRRKVYLCPEPKSLALWEQEEGASFASGSASDSAYAPRHSLASLYRPPFHLMFHGTFEQAKATSSSQDKWLLVNLQSKTEFSSHMLNRDTWANEVFSQIIKANFIFWQNYEDTLEGREVCAYYKLESTPVVLVIHPTTGQKMRMWSGVVGPETLLEDLVPYMDDGPGEHITSHVFEGDLT